MKHALLMILTAAGGAAAALALPSCNSDPLAGCTFAHVDTEPSSVLFVAVNDSTLVSAQVTSDCGAVGNVVDFSLQSPALAALRATSATSAIVRGIAVGRTWLYVTPHDYPQNRDSLLVQVIGPNP